VIILNSSPIIHLHVALGGLDPLPALYGKVLVPREVQVELEAGSGSDDSAAHLKTISGIAICDLSSSISPLLAGELDLGEAAVIQLALERPGATVVLDDLKARRVARRAAIPVTGSLGILLDAKRAGALSSVREAVERMRRHGAWLSDEVVGRVLALADE
jgi:predicted nucleic acid-binding protein